MSRRMYAFAVALALLPVVGLAQDGPRPEDRPRGERRPPHGPPPPMLFFTDKIVNLAVDRVVDDMADHYRLSEDQFEFIREEVRSRFPSFMLENRDQIIEIANQYTEAMLSGEPPTKEFVAQWSQKTLPLVNQFAEMIEETRESIRPILTEEQQVQMDGEMAAFRVAMNHVNNRMNVWAQGGYDWESEWPRSEAFKEQERVRVETLLKEQERAKAIARGESPPPETAVQTAATTDAGAAPPGAAQADAPKPKPGEKPGTPRPKDEWDVYVENFIKRYKLDDAQQNQARKNLIGLQEQRDRYARRKLAEIEELKKKLKAAKSDDEKSELKARLVKIQEPIDRMFNQLKDKLDTIPTRKQRADAAKADLDKSAAAKPAESGEKNP